jgi:hypothetical protein
MTGSIIHYSSVGAVSTDAMPNMRCTGATARVWPVSMNVSRRPGERRRNDFFWQSIASWAGQNERLRYETDHRAS